MSTPASAPVLEVSHLVKSFSMRQSVLAALQRKPATEIRAVDDVSFILEGGEVLALVGESGCGKTTIARALIGLEEPTSGEIRFSGEIVSASRRRVRAGLLSLDSGRVGTREHMTLPQMSLKRLRQHAQMIFQDPYESLNPRATVYEIVAEPLQVHGIARKREERLDRVRGALEDAGLRPAESFFERFPHELSGGQRQRVVIAGAMVLKPELLLADEPVSMLDVSIRAEILNLLSQLRTERGVSILFITHDLGTVSHFADRIAVMYLGRLVEIGPTRPVLEHPQHPYTRALLSVVPVANPRLRRERVILQGETPNAADVPAGCRFHPRCPVVMERCSREDPPYITGDDGHGAACWLVDGPAVKGLR
ncbi:MAG: ABC transporter ATP-binding protein [Chloroflexota bacterium]